MDVHHGRPHPHAGHHGLVGPLITQRRVVVRYVRAGSPHVKGHDFRVATLGGCLGARNDPACGARQNGVLAPKRPRGGQPSVALGGGCGRESANPLLFFFFLLKFISNTVRKNKLNYDTELNVGNLTMTHKTQEREKINKR